MSNPKTPDLRSVFFFLREVNDAVGWLIQAETVNHNHLIMLQWTWLHPSSIFSPPNHSIINAWLDKGRAFCNKFASELFCTQPLGDRKTRVRERNLPSQRRLGERSVPGRAWEKKKFASQIWNGWEKFARQSRHGSEKLSAYSGYRVTEIGMQQAL